MSSGNRSKLNLLRKLLPSGGVITVHWLESNGFSQQLSHRYLKNGWLERIGPGVFKWPDDEIDWPAALNAVQKQLMIPLHVGAKSALEVKGLTQYLRLSPRGTIFLFGNRGGKKLPKWFKDQDWEYTFQVTKNNLFPAEFQKFTDVNSAPINITISCPERAAFEMLYLIPEKQSWEEADLIFENLRNLRSKYVQEHLEKCRSIKVKRLFLFFANKHNHSWFKKLKLTNVKLGSGKRRIAKKGRLDKRYKITVPNILSEVSE